MRYEWIYRQIQPGETIVDIGANDGHTFANWPDRDLVTNVDIDLYDVWNFVQADASNLPFEDKKFDVAVLAEILEHVPDSVAVLKEAKRVAKRVVITTPNEHKWKEEAKPFHPVEKWEEETGKSRYELAKEGNDPVQFYDGDNLQHLWHCRFYTEESLRQDLKEAGLEITSFAELSDDFFVWFCVNAN